MMLCMSEHLNIPTVQHWSYRKPLHVTYNKYMQFWAKAFFPSWFISDRRTEHQHQLFAESLWPPRVWGWQREHQLHPSTLRRPFPNSESSFGGNDLPGGLGPGAAGEETHPGVYAALHWWGGKKEWFRFHFIRPWKRSWCTKYILCVFQICSLHMAPAAAGEATSTLTETWLYSWETKVSDRHTVSL